jgi:hypothetical protein
MKPVALIALTLRRMWATGNLTMYDRMERIAAILEEAELRAEECQR